MFVGLHTMLAMQTDTPEFMLSDEEGRDFTKAAQNVMRHYSVQSTQKTLDWIAFGGITVGIYGPRFVAVRLRKAQEARGAAPGGHWRPGDGSGEVVELRPVTPSPIARERPNPLRRRPARADAAATPPASESAPMPHFVPSVPEGPEHTEEF